MSEQTIQNDLFSNNVIISLGWEGDIPVISSDVDNDGILCYVSKHKLQREKDLINYPCITWTVDGMAGTLTARNYPFVPNNHCGWLTPKAEGLDFLGKDELARLEKKEKELDVSLKEKTGSLEVAVKSAYKNSYDVSLATLLNYVFLNTAHYATGLYLQKSIKGWRDVEVPEISPAILSAMINIESLFLSASQANRDDRVLERKVIAKSGVDECSFLLNQLAKDTQISAKDKPAIDITDQALGRERTDLTSFISTL